METGYFVGIDPGATGALGIVGERGEFIAAHRWRPGRARSLYHILYGIREKVRRLYIEQVRIFPREEIGFIIQGQSLLVNLGIWQGFALAMGLTHVMIDPATWQAAYGLTHWRTQGLHSPLTLARVIWPNAPLAHRADEGAACALLLADLARRDYQLGLDRAALQAAAAVKKKARLRQLRNLKKLEVPHNGS